MLDAQAKCHFTCIFKKNCNIASIYILNITSEYGFAKGHYTIVQMYIFMMNISVNCLSPMTLTITNVMQWLQ